MRSQADMFGDSREIPEQQNRKRDPILTALFSEGVSVLVKAGMKEPSARRFIARLKGQGYRPDLILDALRECADQSAVEPQSYTVGYLKKRQSLHGSYESWAEALK